MPYGPDGIWIPEDDGVANKVAQLQTTDSPLFRGAVNRGTRAAARRGLSNSSIAVGAEKSALLDVVVPIASQDASQINQKNLQFTDQRNQRELTAAQIAASDRANFGQAITSAGNTYTSGIAETLQNSKIPAATRSAVQADIAKLYETQQAQFAKLYGVNLTWGAPAAPATAG